jgi:hypothetical protein
MRDVAVGRRVRRGEDHEADIDDGDLAAREDAAAAARAVAAEGGEALDDGGADQDVDDQDGG